MPAGKAMENIIFWIYQNLTNMIAKSAWLRQQKKRTDRTGRAV